MSRIRQETRYALNPFPHVDDETVLRLSNVSKARRPARGRAGQPFTLRYQFSTGHDREVFFLEPGSEPLSLRGEGEWLDFETHMQEQGGVLVKSLDDEDVIREAKIDSLRRAMEFYEFRGESRVDDIQIRQGWSDPQLVRQRCHLWIYYYNQIRCDLAEKELDRLLAGGPLENGWVSEDGEVTDGPSTESVELDSGGHSAPVAGDNRSE